LEGEVCKFLNYYWIKVVLTSNWKILTNGGFKPLYEICLISFEKAAVLVGFLKNCYGLIKLYDMFL